MRCKSWKQAEPIFGEGGGETRDMCFGAVCADVNRGGGGAVWEGTNLGGQSAGRGGVVGDHIIGLDAFGPAFGGRPTDTIPRRRKHVMKNPRFQIPYSIKCTFCSGNGGK